MMSIKCTKIIVALFFLVILSLPVSAQGPAKGKIDPERDPTLEISAKHNLQVARWSITKRKAYKGGLDRLQEIVDTYPTFSRIDEVYYWMGEAHFRLNEFDKAAELYGKLVKEFPESEFFKKSNEQLEKIKSGKR
jgi:TolA-binding protein